jgi:hypothetical protein
MILLQKIAIFLKDWNGNCRLFTSAICIRFQSLFLGSNSFFTVYIVIVATKTERQIEANK